MNSITTVNGSLSDILWEFVSNNNYAYQFKKDVYLNGNIIIPGESYFVGIKKLFRECTWSFLIDEKLRLPSFLYKVIKKDDYDQDGLLKESEYFMKFIDILISENLIEIVDFTEILNNETRKRIFDSAYSELYEIVCQNIDSIFPPPDIIMGKEIVFSAYSSRDFNSYFDKLLHKYLSIHCNVPVTYIDGLQTNNQLISNSIDSTLKKQFDHIQHLMDIFLPQISFIENSSDFFRVDFFEKIKPVIESIHLLKESPLCELLLASVKSTQKKQESATQLKTDNILLLNDFLKRQKKIKKIKRISMWGDKILNTAGLAIPLVGFLSFTKSMFEDSIFNKYEKGNYNKISSEYPNLRRLYLSDKDLKKEELEKFKNNYNA